MLSLCRRIAVAKGDWIRRKLSASLSARSGEVALAFIQRLRIDWILNKAPLVQLAKVGIVCEKSTVHFGARERAHLHGGHL